MRNQRLFNKFAAFRTAKNGISEEKNKTDVLSEEKQPPKKQFKIEKREQS